LQSAFFNVFVIALAVVLRVESEYRRTQSVIKGHKEVYQFVSRAEPVLRGSAGNHFARFGKVEFHHSALHNDYAYRKNGKLYSERHALFNVRGYRFYRRLKILFLKPHFLVFYKRIGKARRKTQQLRKHRGERRARGSHSERRQKQNVKPDVQRGGNYQKYERSNRIAVCAQHAANEVITHLGYDSDKYYKAIIVRRGIYFGVCGRNVYHFQKPRKSYYGNGGQQRGNYQHKVQLRRKRTPCAARVGPSHASGGYYRKPRRTAEREL